MKRQKLSSLAVLAVAAMLMALPLGLTPVSALDTDDDDNTSTTTDDTTDAEMPQTTRTRVQNKVTDAQEKAKANLEAVREKKQTQTEEHRQLLCENRQGTINNKISAFTKAADTQLANLDSVYAKLKSYQTDTNVSVSNFNDLTTAADAKRQVVVDDAAALKEVATGVDCTNADVAVQLGTVKQAAQTTRQALRDYRAALHNILVALAQAKEAAASDTTSEGDN